MARRTNRQSGTSSLAIEFCVQGGPVSAQTSQRDGLRAWKRRVTVACRQAWPKGRSPLEGDLTVKIAFYRETVLGDVDNLTKPILDAMQSVVYANDRQVSDVTAARRDINARFRVRHISMPLATAFSRGEQFVHIRVYRVPKRRDLVR
jgi:crossover junction endodeoxyribonuclease RusA